MKTYYCVTSSFDDRGRATANITDIIKTEESMKQFPLSEFRGVFEKVNMKR